jgi:polyisoprenoid-binding protein YceI
VPVSNAARSPFAPVALPVVALIAALVRWQVQGSRNIWPALSKRFYIPDPDLGTRVSSEHRIWLGLAVCAVIAAIAAGVAVGGWIIRRREAARGAPARTLRTIAWIAGALTLIAPIAAFLSGGRPAGGLDTLPAGAAAAVVDAGRTGTIDAPGGRYEVVEHAGTSITARLSAGGDTFDARFSGGIQGNWKGDPRDLAKPVTAEVSVNAASVDTGVGERSKHASEEYLHADKFPRITVTIDRLIAVSQAGPNNVGFRAHATLGLIGKTHSIEITGTLRKPDATAIARLGLSGEILLVKADFDVVIKETALASDAGDFDGSRIPIQVSLVLRHTGG